MTCIVGLVHDGVTYIGGDSLGSNGYTKTVRKDKKVFKLKDTDNAIAGYTSSFRMGQLLMYGTGFIDKRDEPNINHEYLVTRTIPKIISTFEEGGFGRNSSGDKSGGTFLFGYKDKLYVIHDDYQVGESFYNYDAVGCGEDFAKGSLHATEGIGITPVERIHSALKAASQFSAGVAPPYYIINTNNNEVVELEI